MKNELKICTLTDIQKYGCQLYQPLECLEIMNLPMASLNNTIQIENLMKSIYVNP